MFLGQVALFHTDDVVDEFEIPFRCYNWALDEY